VRVAAAGGLLGDGEAEEEEDEGMALGGN